MLVVGYSIFSGDFSSNCTRPSVHQSLGSVQTAVYPRTLRNGVPLTLLIIQNIKKNATISFKDGGQPSECASDLHFEMRHSLHHDLDHYTATPAPPPVLYCLPSGLQQHVVFSGTLPKLRSIHSFTALIQGLIQAPTS